MFEIGERVVYPMHGAGVIEGIEEKELLGEIKQFYILKLPIKNMKVMLPIDSAEKLGVRRVVDKIAFNDVITVLAQDKGKMPDIEP